MFMEGPQAKRETARQVCRAVRSFTARAFADLDRPAQLIDRFVGDVGVEHLLHRRLLLDVADVKVVLDGPRGALGIVAGVHRPDAVVGERLPGVFHRVFRPAGRLHDDRHHLGFVLVDGAAGFNHGGNGVNHHVVVMFDPGDLAAIGVVVEVWHQIRELHEHVQPGVLLLGQEYAFRMQRDAVDLPGHQARQATGGGTGDELHVVDLEAGG
jgi:hypothetical protein